MKGIIKYDQNGEMPNFKNPVLTALFSIIKTDLDSNKENWGKKVISNRINGKKGGRPRKTQITRDNPNNPQKPDGFPKTQITHENPNNPQKPDHDSGGGGDLGYEFESGGGSENSEPPPLITHIKNESERHGFFIDTAIALQFQNCGLDPDWLAGPHSFLEFSAVMARKKYPDKDDAALKPIFISAVKSWEDLRNEYPVWKAKQFEKQQKQTGRNARANYPEKCQCGEKLNARFVCRKCGGRYFFDEQKLEYVFSPKSDVSLAKDFKAMMAKRQLGDAEIGGNYRDHAETTKRTRGG